MERVEEELSWLSGKERKSLRFPISDNTDDEADKPEMSAFHEAYKVGKTSLKERNWVEAVGSFSEMILAYPKVPSLYVNRSLALLKLGKHECAEIDCTLALDLRADWDKALLRRSLARKHQGKYVDACFDLMKLMELYPEFESPTSLIRGEYDVLVTQAVEELSKNYGRNQIWKDKLKLGAKEKDFGNDFVKRKHFGAAVIKYSNAIRLVANDPTYYANRAICWMELKYYKNAESDCTKALSLDKKYVKALVRRGRIRKALENFKGARDDFGRAFILNPKDCSIAQEFEEVAELIRRKKRTTSEERLFEANVRANIEKERAKKERIEARRKANGEHAEENNGRSSCREKVPSEHQVKIVDEGWGSTRQQETRCCELRQEGEASQDPPELKCGEVIKDSCSSIEGSLNVESSDRKEDKLEQSQHQIAHPCPKEEVTIIETIGAKVLKDDDRQAFEIYEPGEESNLAAWDTSDSEEDTIEAPNNTFADNTLSIIEKENFRLPFIFKPKNFEEEIDRISSTDEDDDFETFGPVLYKPKFKIPLVPIFEMKPLNVPTRFLTEEKMTRVPIKTTYTVITEDKFYNKIVREMVREAEK